MLSKVASAGLIGTEGYIAMCEADVGDGLPGISMIGYLSASVREAQDRVRTAIRNSGFRTESKKITINISPADVRKEGCGYDLPIAVALLRSYGITGREPCDALIRSSVFCGELSLGGDLLGIHGVLSLACAARDAGYRRIFVPLRNAAEGAAIDGIDCCGIRTLNELVEILNGEEELPEPAVYTESPGDFCDIRDFSDVCGQEAVKRATFIAVGGRHNILYIGPAGTGKSMIASRIPGIMPQMTKQERLEISKIYSVSGLLPDDEPLHRARPFRSPHHTISPQALSGGGAVPRPGEISLASGGVLFLDELAEFRPAVIETLRQPMEERKVTISRVHGTVEYPSDFVLCAATNPCRCGFYPDRTRCRCTQQQVRSYLGRISKPLLDRIDICIETAVPRFSDLKGSSRSPASREIREQIERVRRIQEERCRGTDISFNSEMNGRQIDCFCCLSGEDEEFLHLVYEKKGLSARGLHKILRVARTIADFDDSLRIRHEHLCEAISYRSLEEKYWGGEEGYDSSPAGVPL